MLKRTFIPPSHRPHVRGTSMDDGSASLHLLIKNRSARRDLISNIIAGEGKGLPFCTASIRALFLEAFSHGGDKDVQTR